MFCQGGHFLTQANHRRVPRQERSRIRYDAVLDTASKLFSEKGFEATTTNDIAERAGMAVGSLYQYFENKEAIAEALAARYVDALREATDRFIKVDVAGMTTDNAVSALLDPLIEFHVKNPAFSPLWLGADHSKSLRHAMGSMEDNMLERIEWMIRSHMPGIRRDRAHMAAVVAKATGKSLLGLLVRGRDTRFKNAAIKEVRAMLVNYFEAMIAEHVPRQPKRR
jgi:AcrR family transcriptional regulator